MKCSPDRKELDLGQIYFILYLPIRLPRVQVPLASSDAISLAVPFAAWGHQR